ncbi:MAG: ABC transporter substrate-binding protein [Clostridia bacterium]|nr:ABC transporter substrate-binding protein [Clostridia bacterium]
MRQHIDTIPVWDAFKQDCECPLCELRATNEDNYVHSFTGGSVMEPDVRVEVNMKGFCARHFNLMMVGDRRLGVALMAHTYLKQTMARLGEASQAVQDVPAKAKKSLFGSKKPVAGVDLSDITDSCILCDRLNATMERYIYTTVHLWKKDSSFRSQFKNSKGFCLKHYARLLNAAPEQLNGQELKQFNDMLNDVEMTNLKRVADEIEWFTLKFDHKNADKPWGNSRDALPRTVLKLRGKE